MVGHAVHDRAHAVLADAEVEVPPQGVAAVKSPMSARLVLFDGARSAEPPTRFGMTFAMAFSTFPLAARVARDSPAAKAGIATRGQIDRSVLDPGLPLLASAGFSAFQAARVFFHCS